METLARRKSASANQTTLTHRVHKTNFPGLVLLPFDLSGSAASHQPKASEEHSKTAPKSNPTVILLDSERAALLEDQKQFILAEYQFNDPTVPGYFSLLLRIRSLDLAIRARKNRIYALEKELSEPSDPHSIDLSPAPAFELSPTAIGFSELCSHLSRTRSTLIGMMRAERAHLHLKQDQLYFRTISTIDYVKITGALILSAILPVAFYLTHSTADGTDATVLGAYSLSTFQALYQTRKSAINDINVLKRRIGYLRAHLASVKDQLDEAQGHFSDAIREQ